MVFNGNKSHQTLNNLINVLFFNEWALEPLRNLIIIIYGSLRRMRNKNAVQANRAYRQCFSDFTLLYFTYEVLLFIPWRFHHKKMQIVVSKAAQKSFCQPQCLLIPHSNIVSFLLLFTVLFIVNVINGFNN